MHTVPEDTLKRMVNNKNSNVSGPAITELRRRRYAEAKLKYVEQMRSSNIEVNGKVYNGNDFRNAFFDLGKYAGVKLKKVPSCVLEHMATLVDYDSKTVIETELSFRFQRKTK